MLNKVKKKNVSAVSRLILCSIFLAATFLFVGVQEAAAVHGGTTNGECMVDRYNVTKPASVNDLNCTSNDVQLAIYEVVSGPATCLEGEVIDVVLKGDFVATSNERWDVGVFISEDGGTPNALGGSCYSDYLHPVSADNTDLDLVNGEGPFYNGEITEDPGDMCGDIQQNINNTFITGELSIVCQDNDNDFIADVTSCTVWSNSRSDGGTNKSSCIDEADVTAETTAKCTCEAVNIIGIDFLEQAQIEVVKDLVPFDAPGLFNLQIDGVDEAPDVTDGGTTGPVLVGAGTQNFPGADHTVGETAGTGTTLSAYEISISCVDAGLTTFDGGAPLTFSGAGPLTVPVDPDDDIVCTITNTNLCWDAETRCDDGATCTTDTCNPDTGECINTPDDAVCDDGDVCTIDTCNPDISNLETGCVYEDSGLPQCLGGICVPELCDNPDNPCDEGACNDDGTCADPVALPDSTPCEDGDACTSETGSEASPDHCLAGSCTGVPVGCGPGDQCNDDVCDPGTGTCGFVPKADSTPCEDGDACTSETGSEASPDHCLAGSCTGIPVGCGPGDECNDDVCDPGTGTCGFVPKADSTPCEDGDACTSETGSEASPDHCLAGSCTGVPVGCGPGDQCNDDVCDPGTGTCGFVPKADSTPCEDGDACTSETGSEASPDHCLAGSCTGIPVGCGPGDECNDDVCDPGTGTCGFVPKADSTPCEDGDACTSETGSEASPDHCLAGSCTGVPVGCGPGDQCNDDVCDPGTGTCGFVPKADSTPCQDGDACTSETGSEASPDHCLAGSCTGVPVGCGPGDQCNDDVCDPGTGTCGFIPKADSTPCQDGDACTSETGSEASPDHCLAGSCTGVPVGCGPGDQCNDDVCDPGTGTCGFVPKADSTPCEDGDACTSETGSEASPDHCLAGSCTGVPVGCGPGDQCNDDVCDSGTGTCGFVPKADSTPCQDGDACTSETGSEASPDHCLAGSCTGIPVGCGPGDQCNDDVCDPGTGTCGFVPKADSTPCQDGDACTSETGSEASPDHCLAGSCTGVPVGCGPGDQCNDDVCDPGTGTCGFVPKADSTPCEDGDACTSETGAEASPDHCLAGSCTGVPVGCGPGDQCNDDVCDPGTGTCGFVPKADSTPCEDGEFCTSETGAPQTPDHCEAGVCTGVPVDCSSEDDDCNVGTCDPQDGACFPDPLPVDTACGDDTDNDCTDPDTCDGEGNCLPNNEECAYVTNSSLCPFDVYSDVCDGDSKFRVVFTPDMQNWPAYKQNSTNPGQYYYNLIYDGSAGDTVRIVVPWPFVTQGATPLHVYDADTLDTVDGCFEPCDDCALSSERIQISLDDWADGGSQNTTGVTCNEVCGPDGVGNCWFDVTLPLHPDYDNCNAGETCSYYVNLHLDWGLKGTHVDANPCDDGLVDRYDKGANDNALVDDTEVTGLSNCRTFDFCHDGTLTECSGAGFFDSVQNVNEFKRIRGFGGIVEDCDTDDVCVGVVGAEVWLFDSAGNVLETMTTDADGWYLSEYQHKGKEAVYTLSLVSYGQEVDVTVGKNVKYGEGNFDITP